jgi:hypothetical protein
LDSSQFDEYLIVINPNGTRAEIDTFVGTPPEVFKLGNARSGTYTIWANSYNVSTGAYQLCVGPQMDPPCKQESTPSSPIPADEATNLSVDLELSWNNLGKNKVIYGTDDRRDVYQVSDPGLLDAYDSTVVLVQSGEITDDGNGTYTLSNVPWTSQDGMPLCMDEPFRGQPNPGFCSGFLVDSDVVATAGHCVTNPMDCEDTYFVFGFQMLDANTPALTVPASDVYRCAGILDRDQSETNGEDWALIQLDRPVEGHDPLPVRRDGTIGAGQGLVLIGYPVGLPAKIAGGASVRTNSDPIFFVANTDSYGGNSGSAVLNADTLVVEGILIRGDTDFVADGACTRSNQCPNDGCRGEDVTRIARLEDFIPPPPQYHVYFGPCGNLQMLGTTEDLTWPLTGLAMNTTYCWRIDVDSGCAVTTGLVWTFTTLGGGGMDYDVVEDNLIDAKDLLLLMKMQMLGENNLFGFAMNWKTMTTKRIVGTGP